MSRLGASAASTTVLATVMALSGVGFAYAYFTGRGVGSGAAVAGSTSSVTLAPAAVSAGLYPGGTATVALTVTNPNQATVRIGGLTLDTSQGSGGFAVDADHSGCGLDAFTFPDQTNSGSGWDVPAADLTYPGSLTISLPSSITASTSTANACQGATLTVYLKTTS